MTYATPVQLADARLARELAQVTTPERVRVIADELMEATLRGTDRSAWSAAEIAIADECLRTITRRLRDADSTIDGYLRTRKPRPYTVPLDPVPELVTLWARWIARYLLHQDRRTEEKDDPIVRDYKQALQFLQLTAEGKFSLGGEDPLPPASAGSPEICAPEREFTMHTLRDYGT
ncbi:gp436 family protein [Lysobacter sp. CA199]|uniref:gp436 family protein n=1 Tax=Lysobacter sp. CA199 TaxID=3455608 RepID=UPI003F8D3272